MEFEQKEVAVRRVVGVVALLVTVVLWSTFALSTRAIGGSNLHTGDVALLRFGVPFLLTLPWLPRAVTAVGGERSPVVPLLLIGGLPHYLLFAHGASLTSAGLTGLLVPGTVPLFVTILLLRRVVPSWRRGAALVLITGGVAWCAVVSGGGARTFGVFVLLSAGFAWAVYTIGLRKTKLRLLDVIVVVNASSLAAVTLALAITPGQSTIVSGGWHLSELLLFAGLQGVGTGLASTAAYAVAVRYLDGGLAAAGGALSPVLTALVAVPLLHEPVTAGFAAALGVIVAGVIIFNWPARRMVTAVQYDPASRKLERVHSNPRPFNTSS